MGLFNFIETIFFFSLAITFLLILLLVYHFKQRISTMEQKSDTMFDIINGVVKELTNIKKIVMLQSQLIRPSAVFPQHSHQPINQTHSQLSPVLEENEYLDEGDDRMETIKPSYEEMSDVDDDDVDNIDADDDLDADVEEIDDMLSVSDNDDATHNTINFNNITKHDTKENEFMFDHSTILSSAIPISMADLGNNQFSFGNVLTEILLNTPHHEHHSHIIDEIGKDDRVEELIDVDGLQDENIQHDIEELDETQHISLDNIQEIQPVLTFEEMDPIKSQVLEDTNTLEENVDINTDITTTHVPETIYVNKLEETIEIPSFEISSETAPDPTPSNREMYDKMTVQQLKALAITRGIATNVKKMPKSELIKLLLTEE